MIQIGLLDAVFSLDFVITAVGLAQHISIMAIAIILAVCVMLFAAKSIADLVDNHPTIKISALSFLLLVGVTLIVEGFDVYVPKGDFYFAMAFFVGVDAKRPDAQKMDGACSSAPRNEGIKQQKKSQRNSAIILFQKIV